MIFIDTHTHLYAKEFAADIATVIERAESEGVQKFFLPAIDSTATEDLLQLESRFPGKCIAMMGLHPCYVKDNYKEELKKVEEWLGKRRFAAVGEIGIDHYWDTSFAKEQEEAFRIQIEWALHYRLPIVIHTRNAMQETINIVKEYSHRGIRGIFHCFGGSLESAKEIIKAGFYLGIGGVVTYPKAGLADVLKDINLEHLVLETDAPYLSPIPFRGKRNESSYLKYIAQRVAEAKNVSLETVAQITTANAENIFGA